MSGMTFGKPSETWLRLVKESTQRSSSLHRQFLTQRQGSLQGVKALIELQMRAGAGSVTAIPASGARPAVFSSAQLDAFGTGKISDCLGPDFVKYDQRKRVARIPNGDLKMMSRVVTISGIRRDPSSPAETSVEYDVPNGAWYQRDNASGEIPLSLVMEIGLQPPGFLSAYLDTYSLLPAGEYYFRNLDGMMKLYAPMPGPGGMITTHARLLSSVVSGGTAIQKFGMTLTSGGQKLGEIETVFGYFPAASMVNQVGLDGGKSPQPWVKQNGQQAGQWANLAALARVEPIRPRYRLSGGQMNFLDQAYVEANGGQQGKGYVYASHTLRPDEWFYPFHFHQDPVMPGSLGIEAIVQAMQVYALQSGLGQGLRKPFMRSVTNGAGMQWRYRGQIVATNKQMEVEVHINTIERGPEGVTIRGDASLWADGLRIYEVKNASLAILEEK